MHASLRVPRLSQAANQDSFLLHKLYSIRWELVTPAAPSGTHKHLVQLAQVWVCWVVSFIRCQPLKSRRVSFFQCREPAWASWPCLCGTPPCLRVLGLAIWAGLSQTALPVWMGSADLGWVSSCVHDQPLGQVRAGGLGWPQRGCLTLLPRPAPPAHSPSG